ncbi:hypothetical protein AB0I94_23160 [Streptomyces sp. NPDC050147]|uniref:hypothetical protein n=1 Tax=Streptomyces sp. NPDC050147 TaxID=3155513 RepID=UPI0034415C2C
MLFTRDALTGIASGEIDLAFRRWRRPAVRPGTELRTEVGVLVIGEVEMVPETAVTDRDARRAGFADRERLLAGQRPGEDRRLYRIGVRLAGDDPRIRLRQDTDVSAARLDEIVAELGRVDAGSRRGPWTTQVLELIAGQPCVSAAELAAQVGREKLPFKADVRKLKERGLTESLATGYRLSPRGMLVLGRLRASGQG